MKGLFDVARRGRGVLVAGLLLTLAACGKDKVVRNDDVVVRKAARIEGTFSNAEWSLSPTAQFNFRLAFDVTLRESNGTAAKLNFLRVEFRDQNGNNVERQEAGSNRLSTIPANGTLSDRITVDFNDGRTSSALVIISATDDTGQTHEIRLTILCC